MCEYSAWTTYDPFGPIVTIRTTLGDRCRDRCVRVMPYDAGSTELWPFLVRVMEREGRLLATGNGQPLRPRVDAADKAIARHRKRAAREGA